MKAKSSEEDTFFMKNLLLEEDQSQVRIEIDEADILQNIPAEIWHLILSPLPYSQDLANLSSVSKNMKEVVKNTAAGGVVRRVYDFEQSGFFRQENACASIGSYFLFNEGLENRHVFLAVGLACVCAAVVVAAVIDSKIHSNTVTALKIMGGVGIALLATGTGLTLYRPMIDFKDKKAETIAQVRRILKEPIDDTTADELILSLK